MLVGIKREINQNDYDNNVLILFIQFNIPISESKEDISNISEIYKYKKWI